MNQTEITQLFEQQAAGYNQQWANMAPINQTLHFLLKSTLTALPVKANILCVGAGTGTELIYLAKHFPQWTFTALEPSAAMLAICREETQKAGVAARCHFHHGYLDSLPDIPHYHAATCFLVSHFMLDQTVRKDFFKQIATKLITNGILVSADLAADTESVHYDALLGFWLGLMSQAIVSPADISKLKTAYSNDVAIVAPQKLAKMIQSAGFTPPTPIYQAGMIHAFFAKRCA